MSEGDLAGIKCTLHALVEVVIAAGISRGIALEEIYRVLATETLHIAAGLYADDEVAFFSEARRALALARTGNIEQ